MKAKEYLGQYIKAKRYAEECFTRLDAALSIGPKSPVIDGMPKNAGSLDLADTVAKIERIRKKAEVARQHAIDLADEIYDVIEDVSDLDERTLLRFRYIYGMKWEEVAAEMHYSTAHIYRIHGRALLNVKIRTKESK